MALSLLLLVLSLCCGENDAATASALFVEHGGLGHHPLRRLNRRTAEHYYHPSSPQRLSSANANSEKTSRKEMARQLLEENAMPPLHESANDDNVDDPLSHYDEDKRTPVESEFLNLMTTFLTYSKQDIQSLTTTSTRYIHYHHHSQNGKKSQKLKRPRKRSKEDGIRYRALYSGVQAASLEPEVLRSFTVLFEDYSPIRIAGRRIYGHLGKVMEEVREERMGEIARTREVCPSWDRKLEGGDDIITYARQIWDTIMDEALLLEHSLESDAEYEQSQEGGVISLSQLFHLGIDQVLIKEGLVNDIEELQGMLGQIAHQENIELKEYYNIKKEHDMKEVKEDMTFAIFMKMLYQCSIQMELRDDKQLINVLQMMEQCALDQRIGSLGDQDTSTILAAKAIHSGSTSTCTKRQKYSDRFDEYVATFKLWERKFLGNANDEDTERQQSRRMEILRGCFFGAQNAKVVAALKIVYMDYAALRLGGDLIFKLMSTIAN